MAYRTHTEQPEEQDEASRLFDEGVASVDKAVQVGQRDRRRAAELCENAIGIFRRVHQLEPEATIVLTRIGHAAMLACNSFEHDQDPKSKKRARTIAKSSIPFMVKLSQADPGDAYAAGVLAKLYGIVGKHSWLGMTRRAMADKSIEVLKRLEKHPAMNEGPKAEVAERWGELCSDLATAYRVRAEVGKQSERTNFLAKSKEQLQIAVDRDPSNIVTRFNSANGQIKLAKLVEDPQTRQTWLEEALEAQLKVVESKETADKSLHFFSHDGTWSPDYIEFNLACVYALLGDSEKALKELEYVAKRENISHTTIVADSDFDSIRDMPEFKAMTKKA